MRVSRPMIARAVQALRDTPGPATFEEVAEMVLRAALQDPCEAARRPIPGQTRIEVSNGQTVVADG